MRVLCVSYEGKKEPLDVSPDTKLLEVKRGCSLHLEPPPDLIEVYNIFNDSPELRNRYKSRELTLGNKGSLDDLRGVFKVESINILGEEKVGVVFDDRKICVPIESIGKPFLPSPVTLREGYGENRREVVQRFIDLGYSVRGFSAVIPERVSIDGGISFFLSWHSGMSTWIHGTEKDWTGERWLSFHVGSNTRKGDIQPFLDKGVTVKIRRGE